MSDRPDKTEKAPEAVAQQALDAVRDALRGLRFGEVRVIVQDGVVVQIERVERRRLVRESRTK